MGDNDCSVAELQARVAVLEHDSQEFTAVAAHDLMEPARTICGFLQLLDKLCGDRLGEEEKKYLQFAVDGSDRMRTMLMAMLELSRVRTQCEAFRPAEMESLLGSVCERLRTQLESVSGTVTHDPLPMVEGDAVQLFRVLLALIDNAIRFSGEHAPRVHVWATDQPDANVPMITFAVKDYGIGIAPKFHDAVFVMFRRLHPRSKDSGPGAGLTISKRIVENHGGRMWVESTEGEGSTFFFSIPTTLDGNHGGE